MRRIRKVGKIALDTTCLSMNVSLRCPEMAEGTGKETFGCLTPHLMTCLRREITGAGGESDDPTDHLACLTWPGILWNTPSRFTCSLMWAAPGVCASPAPLSQADTQHPRSSLGTAAVCPPAARWAHTARPPASTTLPTALTTATHQCWSLTTDVPTAGWPSRWVLREAPFRCRAATSSSPPMHDKRRRSSFIHVISRCLSYCELWQPVQRLVYLFNHFSSAAICQVQLLFGSLLIRCTFFWLLIK